MLKVEECWDVFQKEYTSTHDKCDSNRYWLMQWYGKMYRVMWDVSLSSVSMALEKFECVD